MNWPRLHLAFRHTKYNRLKCNVTTRGELSCIFLHGPSFPPPPIGSLVHSFLAGGTNAPLVLWNIYCGLSLSLSLLMCFSFSLARRAKEPRAAVEEGRPKKDAFRFPRIISREAHSSRRFWSWDCEHERRRSLENSQVENSVPNWAATTPIV